MTPVGDAVADEGGDRRQESGERQSHQEAQSHELPAVADEGLRDEEKRRRQKTADNDLPGADAVGESAEPRRREVAGEGRGRTSA